MNRIVLICFLGLCSWSALFAQKNIDKQDLEVIKNYEDSLMVYSYMILNDTVEENRFAATKLLIPMLVKALKHKNSFEYKFSKLQHVSIQYPQDSTFRIFTFNLYVNDNDYRYYGAIQKNTEDLSLIPLIDRTERSNNLETVELSNKEWLGSVYYNIVDFDTAEGKKYLLFGYDSYSFFNRRKILDVLSFKGDEAIFGAPIFLKKQNDQIVETKNRLVIEFSARASTKLNYDLIQESIIFDNLLPFNGLGKNEPPTWVPDGSYQGYKYNNGLWEHIDKIFCDCPRVDGEAPRSEAILDETPKDLFGN